MTKDAIITDLKFLVDGWRNKAHTIHDTYGKTAPNLVKHCETIIETHASELEDLIEKIHRNDKL